MRDPTNVAVMEVPAGGHDVYFSNTTPESALHDASQAAGSERGWMRVIVPTSATAGVAGRDLVYLRRISKRLIRSATRKKGHALLQSRDLLNYFQVKGTGSVEVLRGDAARRIAALAKPAASGSRAAVVVVARPAHTKPRYHLWQAFHRTMERSPGAAVRPQGAHQATPSAAAAAASLRDELLARGWPTSAEVGIANGSRASSNPGQWAKDKRDAGELLGVWSTSERTYRHPAFQFNTRGELNPLVKDLLAALATVEEFQPANDKGGWHRAFWLHGTALSLSSADGKPSVPAELFRTDPDRVIAFARKDAKADLNGLW